MSFLHRTTTILLILTIFLSICYNIVEAASMQPEQPLSQQSQQLPQPPPQQQQITNPIFLQQQPHLHYDTLSKYLKIKKNWQNLHGSWGKRGVGGGGGGGEYVGFGGYNGDDDVVAADQYDDDSFDFGVLDETTGALDGGDLGYFDENDEQQRFFLPTKRAWKSINGGWGKRIGGQWGKREPGWNNLKGLWGKRSANWNKLSSAWGKRSSGNAVGPHDAASLMLLQHLQQQQQQQQHF